jgi:hypothetical protein
MHDGGMQIRIEGSELPGRRCAASGDFPGYESVHVGVQHRNRRDEEELPNEGCCQLTEI